MADMRPMLVSKNNVCNTENDTESISDINVVEDQ